MYAELHDGLPWMILRDWTTAMNDEPVRFAMSSAIMQLPTFPLNAVGTSSDFAKKTATFSAWANSPILKKSIPPEEGAGGIAICVSVFIF
jgi:hypothetical protein